MIRYDGNVTLDMMIILPVEASVNNGLVSNNKSWPLKLFVGLGT